MKVLIINTFNNHGGAAIAANRLHTGLRKSGVDSTMLVLSTKHKENNIVPLIKTKLSRKIIWHIHNYLTQREQKPYKHFKKNFLSTLYSCNHIINQIKKLNPDIVHLHWINNNFFNISELQRINTPIVWTLHDMWPFTGICHYDEECGVYKTICGKCPQLESDNPHDLANKIFEEKKRIYSSINQLEIIGLSKWIHDCANSSTLFTDRRITQLPNCIDVKLYKQRNRNKYRHKLGVHENKKLILFGGVNGIENLRKGFTYLSKALQLLDPGKFELAVFGSKALPNGLENFTTHNLGLIKDQSTMASIYSSADAMVLPSLQENLSNTVIESLSCGTPVIAFNVGGNPDMIIHKWNGYLATLRNAHSLMDGIVYVTDNDLRTNARTYVLEKFSEEAVIPQYMDFYRELLHNSLQ